MITNDTITTIDHLRDVLNELNFDAGEDRAAIILYTGSTIAPQSNLFFLVATDPDGEWFFLADPSDKGKWRHFALGDLPTFHASHLIAGGA